MRTYRAGRSRPVSPAALLNSGQSCIAAKRFIVPHAAMLAGIRDPDTSLACRHSEDGRPNGCVLRSSDPWRARDLRDELHGQVVRSHRTRRTLCLLGGEIPDGQPGAFYPPTVLTDVRAGNAGLCRKSSSGPLLPSFRWRTRARRSASGQRHRVRAGSGGIHPRPSSGEKSHRHPSTSTPGRVLSIPSSSPTPGSPSAASRLPGTVASSDPIRHPGVCQRQDRSTWHNGVTVSMCFRPNTTPSVLADYLAEP